MMSFPQYCFAAFFSGNIEIIFLTNDSIVLFYM